MPRLRRMRIPALAELLESLRYAPHDAVRRQIDQVIELAPSIDAEGAYPEDFIVYRVTGYRPSIDDPALLVGAAILTDLSTLVEHLCEIAALKADELPGGALSVDDLCERWSVSRKTIDRYRRRGLIACRVRTDNGDGRLRFTARAVSDFEARLGDRLADAASFTRLDDDARDRIIRNARRYRRLGCNMHQAATRLAERTGRAHETIRQILVAHDEGSPDPIFATPAPLDGETRAAIARDYEAGDSIAAICRDTRRSRATIYRVINERRAETLRAGIVELPLRDDPRFDAPSAAERILSPPPVCFALDADVASDLDAFITACREDATPLRDVEHVRAAAAAFLERRAARALADLDRYDPSSSRLDDAETDLRWATRLWTTLVRSERALVLRTLEERLGRPLDDIASDDARRLVDEAMRAAVEGARRHDPFKGGRLAAPVSLALNRRLANLGPAEPLRGARRRDGVAIDDWRRHITPLFNRLFPIDHRRAEFEADGDVADILALRYGWRGERPLTTAETAGRLGLSTLRVRSILRSTGRG